MNSDCSFSHVLTIAPSPPRASQLLKEDGWMVCVPPVAELSDEKVRLTFTPTQLAETFIPELKQRALRPQITTSLLRAHVLRPMSTGAADDDDTDGSSSSLYQSLAGETFTVTDEFVAFYTPKSPDGVAAPPSSLDKGESPLAEPRALAPASPSRKNKPAGRKLLRTETFYDDDFNSFLILHIESSLTKRNVKRDTPSRRRRPRIDATAPASTDVSDVRFERRTQFDHAMRLKGIIGAARWDAVRSSLETVAEKFKKGLNGSLSEPFLDFAQAMETLKGEAKAALTARIMSSTPTGRASPVMGIPANTGIRTASPGSTSPGSVGSDKKGARSSPQHRPAQNERLADPEVECSAIAWLLHQVHDTLLEKAEIFFSHAENNAKLARVLGHVSGMGLSALRIPPELHCNPEAAVRIMARITGAQTPSAKLACVQDAVWLLARSIENGVASENNISADKKSAGVESCAEDGCVSIRFSKRPFGLLIRKRAPEDLPTTSSNQRKKSDRKRQLPHGPLRCARRGSLLAMRTAFFGAYEGADQWPVVRNTDTKEFSASALPPDSTTSASPPEPKSGWRLLSVNGTSVRFMSQQDLLQLCRNATLPAELKFRPNPSPAASPAKSPGSSAGSAPSKTRAKVLTADDQLSYLIYLLSRARPEKLFTQLQIVLELLNSKFPRTDPPMAHTAASLQAAIAFILSNRLPTPSQQKLLKFLLGKSLSEPDEAQGTGDGSSDGEEMEGGVSTSTESSLRAAFSVHTRQHTQRSSSHRNARAPADADTAAPGPAAEILNRGPEPTVDAEDAKASLAVDDGYMATVFGSSFEDSIFEDDQRSRMGVGPAPRTPSRKINTSDRKNRAGSAATTATSALTEQLKRLNAVAKKDDAPVGARAAPATRDRSKSSKSPRLQRKKFATLNPKTDPTRRGRKDPRRRSSVSVLQLDKLTSNDADPLGALGLMPKK